jgi:chromosome segregation ATPase
MLERLKGQLLEAQTQITELNESEQAILERELQIRQQLRESTEKVSEHKKQRDETTRGMKTSLSRRAVITTDKDSLNKKIAVEEISIERGRAQLHDVLQKARVEEVSLPTTTTVGSTQRTLNDMSTTTGGGGAGSQSDTSSDAELVWHGPSSQAQDRVTGNINSCMLISGCVSLGLCVW